MAKQQLELHTLTPVEPTTHAWRSTYRYRTRSELLNIPGGAHEVAKRACIQVPEYMVHLDSVRFEGLWAILTITVDLDSPKPASSN